MSTEFSYTPISEPSNIRLIYLEPGHKQAQLRTQLVEVSLDSVPQYVALSYVWGTQAAQKHILIGETVFHVRPNLYNALKRLRAKGVSIVWADAICINQQDRDERSAQVGLMTRIYRSADKVMFYLGVWRAYESQGLERILMAVLRQPFACGTDFYTAIQETHPLNYNDHAWNYLLKMLRHPWFNRVWTIQESVIARRGRFICGDMQIDQQAFFVAIAYLSKAPDFLSMIGGITGSTKVRHAVQHCTALASCQTVTTGVTGLGSITDVLLRPLPIFDLMVMFNTAAARDSRDYLFALVGISQEANEKSLEPNYRRSISAVSIDLARYEVREGRGTSLLYTASFPSDGSDLPSWVPRLGHRLRHRLAYNKEKGFCFSNIFSASGRSRSTPSLEGDDLDLLVVDGDTFDSIESLGKVRGQPVRLPTNGGLMYGAWVEYMAEILEILETCKKTISGESEVTTSLRVAVCDGWQQNEKADPKKLLHGLRYLVADMLECILSPVGQVEMASQCIIDEELFKVVEQSLKSLHLVAGKLHRNGTPPAKVRSYGQHATDLANMLVPQQQVSGRLSRTTKGRICYVPEDSGVGDRLAILEGCEVPMVLRRSGQHYCIVGPCYVHGVMYGEIWQGASKLEKIYLA
ncbi:hypothetical protein M409DRAFT_54133 [Zasmidium cellare ATCC 36951]|uniref:Heterokaryon incompatibility domain-containing protein n=1 Tax=Zasmidium cellare ATCC 36951 TaxID=1080233 RepID=A0A6A6CPZ2_ZASCE|nr:uncharacterized protein M409DRAFT_54133 [Zasmidium cellare ATCC 36951]KAF2167536.1 hypothetical protein M409DRAFT_54133 [Zasmidium cellare ATCC 36951]